ncbi:MAG: GWxTD domain-containing protein [Bacteroidales bacterium]|jgi:GWxTD domain-containing protein|nr:GWxTD domain-containing protein [Bacteroidales bacterium]
MRRIISAGTMAILFFATLVSGIITSCSTTQRVTVDTKDLSYLYNPTKSSIKPSISVFNQSEASSVLSVKFFAPDLFFSEANPRGVPMAQLLITVKLYNTTSGRILSDTAYVDADVVKEDNRQEYVYKIPMRVQPASSYVAEVKILDKLRAEVIQSFVNFNTLSYFNRYNYIARGHFAKNELHNPVIRENEYVNLLYPSLPADSLFIFFYQPLKVVPYPPSILLPERLIDYPPDTVMAMPYSSELPLMFPEEGVYFCTVDRESQEGFSFFNFGKAFPGMTTPEVMIEPLAYLASDEEMSAMRSAAKPKVALDEFWIKCGGNIEKSRELIRIYYTRVLYSNYYFTSFKEGWRTERGMIYIMYGPPDKVYKSNEGESWGYRRPVLRSMWGGRFRLREDYLWFNFRVRNNDFSENDYYLARSETLVTHWDKAVAAWRKGLVFRLDNPEDL